MTAPPISPRSAVPPGMLARLWRGEAPVLAAALLPAEWLFRLAQGAYHGAHDLRLLPQTAVALPSVSVGNLAVGGAGKTPVSRWLLDELLRRGEWPALLHGGYGDDEPVLHRIWHPQVAVLAGRDRAASAAAAARQGATVLVLDDAFQHRRLRRDVDIVLIPAERWRAHPRLLPRGPWREPPRALHRATVVAVTRKTATAEQAAEVGRQLALLAPHARQLRLAILPAGWRRWSVRERAPGTEPVAGEPKRVGEGREAPPAGGLLVCGVADPELFLVNAEQAGARPAATLIFPDHHPFEPADVGKIRREAGQGAVLTTEKDAVKLSAAAPDLRLWVLEQAVSIEAGRAELDTVLDELLRRRGAGVVG